MKIVYIYIVNIRKDPKIHYTKIVTMIIVLMKSI